MVDELADLRERYVENARRRLAMAAAPLRNGADAVLIVEDPILHACIRYRHAVRKVVLPHASVAALHHEFRLAQVEVVVLGRDRHQFSRRMHRNLIGPE
jgi:hypothetical protein